MLNRMLELAGVAGIALAWFHSFLPGRYRLGTSGENGHAGSPCMEPHTVVTHPLFLFRGFENAAGHGRPGSAI